MKMSLRVLILVFCFKINLAINLPGLLNSVISVQDIKPEQLDFIELAQNCGYKAEKHKVTTEDGYILTLHHIPGNGEPIYLQHGLIESSDGFILRGNKSIVVALARQGYDMWLGNFRGNRYSREHLHLSPDDDDEFWDFSLDEYGYYDVPAIIDYILKETHKTQLTAIGYSEGTAVFYVLGSRRPEYNSKVKVLIALAPVAYLTNVKSPVDLFVDASPIINEVLLLSGQEEILNDQSAFNNLLTLICTTIPLSYEICGGTIFTFVGYDPEEVNEEYIKLLTTYYPAGTSRSNLYHLGQISMSGRFQRYDYGSTKNKKIYGTQTPPEYNLSSVTMPVELIVGKNDKLSTVEDVILLNNELPHSTLHIVPREKMNHIDFVHGENMDEYLFPLIFNALEKFNA